MREILFRGKRCKDGEWVVGSYYKQKEFYGTPFESHVIITSTDDLEYDQALEFHCVQPETVGQFTGLTDKNGKKIFEGDIIEFHAQGDIIVNRGVVVWDTRDARWAYQLRTMQPGFYMHNPEAVEVIGNIHDNPELLKE